jgi:Tol biopolymer transport system component
MKKNVAFLTNSLIVLTFCGCSIQINNPTALSTPSPMPPSTVEPANSTTLSPETTKVPMTWAGLDLTGRLVYISLDTSGDKASPVIQLLALETGELSTIFHSPESAWIYYLSVSPDGRQVIMSYIPPSPSGSSPNRALYTMPLNVDASPQLLFTPPSADDHYTQIEWSPDGKYIYYTHYNSNEQTSNPLYPAYDIFRMAYPDGVSEKILENAFWMRASPDSTKLVYVSIEPDTGNNELLVANADGSNPQKVTFSGAWIPEIIDAPLFSPDGESILFSAPEPTQAYEPNWLDGLMGVRVAKAHSVPSDWWVVPTSGGTPTQLTHLQAINLFGSLSPEGKHIASFSGGGIFVMDLDGSALTAITIDSSNASGNVNWIP